jgi:hypothetical protein
MEQLPSWGLAREDATQFAGVTYKFALHDQ